MAEPTHDRRSMFIRALALPAALLLPARRASGAATCEPTESDFQGPMYTPGAPRRSVLAGSREPGERLRIRGTVFGPDCRTPVPRALLDVWQADAEGRYHDERESYRLRGQLLTDARGQYQIDTIRPGGYGGRPAHIHFTVSAPGHEPLTTQLYFRGSRPGPRLLRSGLQFGRSAPDHPARAAAGGICRGFRRDSEKIDLGTRVPRYQLAF